MPAISKNYKKNNKLLKIAIFGCGKMGMNHFKVIEQIETANVVAVSDPFKDPSSISKPTADKIRFSTEPEEILEIINPDVVHICTPPDTHMNLAKLAMKYGANVYVEKPFALKASDAEEVLEISKQKEVKVCAGHQVLFESAATKTMESLKFIGKIIHIESYFSFLQVRRSLTEVDQLIDILPHPIYLLLHFLNRATGARWSSDIKINSINVNHKYDIHSIINMEDVTGILTVTLHGRPIESYLKIVGTNGCILSDFVRGTVTMLPGPGVSTVSAILNPYSQATQIFLNTTRSFFKRALSKQKSYPGLYEIIESFYGSILHGTPQPTPEPLIVNTVKVSQKVAEELEKVEAKLNRFSKEKLELLEKGQPQIDKDRPLALITGGTGFLGKKVVSELRNDGWPVRVITRQMPSFAERLPGIEYLVADLGDRLSAELFEDVEIVVHCAAETAGSKDEHYRNTIIATKNLLDASAHAGIKKMIHISSIAVLKSGIKTKKELTENSLVDFDNIDRGPYVWAKAAAERSVTESYTDFGIESRIIRLGPLIDLNAFQAPGRLGRELGSRFIAIGGKKTKLSLCTVETAATVIRSYIEKFETAPKVLNLIEDEAPSRYELVQRLLKERPDLKVNWIPFFSVKLASAILKPVLKILFPDKGSIDIYSAFSTENYDNKLASKIIRDMKNA